MREYRGLRSRLETLGRSDLSSTVRQFELKERRSAVRQETSFGNPPAAKPRTIRTSLTTRLVAECSHCLSQLYSRTRSDGDIVGCHAWLKLKLQASSSESGRGGRLEALSVLA